MRIMLAKQAKGRFGSFLTLAVVLGSMVCLRSTAADAQDGRLTLDGAVGWINSEGPIHLEKLRGKIVLIDFWTYCCINCHHVLPDLAKLEQKYKNQLVVIGVHSPKFAAEKETENIRAKVREYQIKHPVANDANREIWQRFGVEGWPTLVLIDAKGEKVWMDSGEGHGAALDALIGALVTKHKARGELDETPIEFPNEVDRSAETGLLYPGKVTADAGSKRLFISDTGHNRIVVTDLTGKQIEVVGNGKPGLVDGDFKSASFHRPQGTCLVDGVLYVADTENHAIRAIDLNESTVKTVAGTGRQGYSTTASGKATATALNSPWDLIAVPGLKVLAVAMAGRHQIWRFDPTKGTISQWAGSGRENIVDGTVATAQFAQPSGLATDGQHLFVADSEVSGVRSISLNSQHRVGTIVGTGLFKSGDVDGQSDAVLLQHCLGLAYGDGKLYIADTYNNKIKVCDPRTRTVRTLAGTTKAGDADDPPTFNEPGGLSLAGSTLFVADTNNHQIRAIDLWTKKVKTLDLANVEPPAREPVYRFQNPTVFNVKPLEVVPGKELTVDLALDLPPGYKLSAEAPLVYLAEADRPGLFTPEVSTTGQKVENPSKELHLKLPLARQALTGSTIQLKLSLSAFVCLPNSLCTVKNYVWNVPITFNPGHPSEVKLTTAKP